MVSLKHIALVLAGASTFLLCGCQEIGPPKEAVTVPSVNLERYAGTWYEIASFPTWFQKGCFCTTAEYAVRDDHIDVKNSCRKGSAEGERDVATGKAWSVPGTGNSQLKVQFFWPFKADYWIIALDENYQWVLVGHPEREYLWILSRDPRMEESLYRSLVEKAREKGYDVTRLKRTDQSCFR
jgi:apolipoprotein D and lipocalin family protein